MLERHLLLNFFLPLNFVVNNVRCNYDEEKTVKGFEILCGNVPSS
jgi:hypothetical protein